MILSSKGVCWRPRASIHKHQLHQLQHHRAPQALHSNHPQSNTDDVREQHIDSLSPPSSLYQRPSHQTQTLNIELQLRQKRLAVFLEFEQFGHAAAERDAIQALLLKQRVNTISTRPVLYPVGTLVRHRIKAFRGVIVGYDLHCRAPPDWIISNNVDGLPHGQQQPFYHVLCDVRDQSSGEVLYVAQDNLVGMRAAAARRPIEHPLLEQYFIDYLEGSYIPNSTLRSQYLDDV